MFCYNQVGFIRPAVRDFLAQEGAGFDLIISDDRSTDGTFDAIREEVAAAGMTERVSLRQPPANLGLNGHINWIVGTVATDYIIPFAGDDRFVPDRASKLVAALSVSGAWLVHSDCRYIDAAGHAVNIPRPRATFYTDYNLREAAFSEALFIGATVGWHRKLFDTYGPLPTTLAYEDLVLGFRAALEDRLAFVDEPLVFYRVGVGLSARNDPRGRTTDQRQGRMRDLRRRRDVLVARQKDVLRSSLPVAMDLAEDFAREIALLSDRIAFLDDFRAGPAILARSRLASAPALLSEAWRLLRNFLRE
jgi:glycosyltransferase involved in cell wall biosynthesis